jgi:hypothetical protein
MWNIANPTSAYQLKSIQNSIETLQSLSTNESNQVIKKRDFIPKSKEIKKGLEEINESSFKFIKNQMRMIY